jgi:hypothetical protein
MQPTMGGGRIRTAIDCRFSTIVRACIPERVQYETEDLKLRSLSIVPFFRFRVVVSSKSQGYFILLMKNLLILFFCFPSTNSPTEAAIPTET